MESTESPDRRTVNRPFLTGLALVVALNVALILGVWVLGLLSQRGAETPVTMLSPIFLLAPLSPFMGLVVAIAGWMHIRRVGPEWWFALGALAGALLAVGMVALAGMP